MTRLLLCVGMILAVAACEAATAPRAFTLGPGCWTVEQTVTPLVGGGTVTLTTKRHFPACPDSLPAGRTLWHWDTTFVEH